MTSEAHLSGWPLCITILEKMVLVADEKGQTNKYIHSHKRAYTAHSIVFEQLLECLMSNGEANILQVFGQMSAYSEYVIKFRYKITQLQRNFHNGLD